MVRKYFNGYDRRWYITIINSDFGFRRCTVETIAGQHVTIPDAPTSRYGYIPVIDGHSVNNNVKETVFYDASSWRIVSDFSQTTAIVFYKIPYQQ